MKYHQIALGWFNLLKSKLGFISPELKELSISRQSICNTCEHQTKYKTCELCGCVIAAKSKVFTETCPDNRWVPVYYEGVLGDTVIICEEVPGLLRERLYNYLGDKPENIPLEKWERFLWFNTFQGNQIPPIVRSDKGRGTPYVK